MTVKSFPNPHISPHTNTTTFIFPKVQRPTNLEHEDKTNEKKKCDWTEREHKEHMT